MCGVVQGRVWCHPGPFICAAPQWRRPLLHTGPILARAPGGAGRAGRCGRKGVSVVVKASVTPEMIRASDFNGDGTVGFADFLAFVPHFGKNPGDAGYDLKFDLDGDQGIGFSDFLIFAQSFGQPVDSAG